MAGTPRIRVLIATTRGPAQVLNIARENPSVRSVICVGGALAALPVSPVYDAFVREPTGVVERMTGHPVYRTDISAPIDAGESWQLGLFLAHALRSADALAIPGELPTMIVLVTGGLDRDLTVTPVSHVAEKLARAGLPGEAPGLFLFPKGSDSVAQMHGWNLVPVSDAEDALAACLGRDQAARLVRRACSSRLALARWRSPRLVPGAMSLIAAAALVAGLAVLNRDPSGLSAPDGHPDHTGASPAGYMTLSIASRDPASGTCGSPEPVPPGVDSIEGAVCFGRISVSSRGEYRLRMALSGAFSHYVDQSRYRRELVRKTDGTDSLVMQIDFPFWLRDPVRLEVVADMLAMDGRPIRSAKRALEIVPAKTSVY